MLNKKQRILSIVFSTILLSGVIAMTPINVFAESPDSTTNAEAESTDGNPNKIQDEGADDSSDEIQSGDINGSSDVNQDENTGESSDDAGEEDASGSSDESKNAGESTDEILDEGIEDVIGADFPSEDTELITDETVNKVFKSIEKQTSGLSITVEYPAQIQCKTPTTFTVNADGGSGDYQYRIHSILVHDGSEYVSVYDVSYGSNSAYQDSNTFSFTFHASGTYYVRFSVRDKKTNDFKNTGFNEYILNIHDSQYPSVEQIVENTVADCVQSCTTDFEKAVWLHDWILDHADYDYSFSYCSAEGVLARGKGTCEAYHRAYVMLLNKAGIATGRITGNGHVWTAVRMDGKWYQVDSTWDDLGAQYKGTYYEHMYFGITDYIIGLVHSDHSSATPGYESTSLENNYFIKTGMITQWSDPFVELIKQNISSGKTEFSLPVTDSSMPDNYKNVIYNLVAYQLSNQNWGSTNISASYKDNVITVKAEAGLGELSSLTITPPTKTLYKKGEAVDTTGLTVTANYMNGARKLREDEYRIGNFDTSTAGTRTATITFGGKSATFQYTVQERQDSGNVYNGIDYSAVYDYTYYISKHADLKQAFGENQYKALEHFVNSGMSEGRQGKDSFNVYAYMNRYADLKNAFGNNLKSYYMHYINNGIKEGRDGSGENIGGSDPTPPSGSAPVYNGVDYSAVYDYNYYLTKYADLKKAFNSNKDAALQHFVTTGMSEGRQGKSSFNVHAYMNRYEDLRNVFGNNLKSYYMHYITNGVKEGRDGSEEIGGNDPTPPPSSAPIYNGVDYSAVYDYNYYLTKYADLKSAFNNNESAALQHFVNTGMSEGRQGKDSFNVYTYMNRYADLRNAFGNDLKNYYLHYISSGLKEGRSGN